MSRFFAASFLLVSFLALHSAGAVQVVTVPEPQPLQSVQAPHDVRFTGGQRLGALIVSSSIGFGVGHKMMGGQQAKAYGLTQLAGLLGVMAGFGAGPELWYTGAALYCASRVLEVGDVIVRPIRHNARVDASAKNAEAAKVRDIRLAPLIYDKKRGLAVNIRF